MPPQPNTWSFESLDIPGLGSSKLGGYAVLMMGLIWSKMRLQSPFSLVVTSIAPNSIALEKKIHSKWIFLFSKWEFLFFKSKHWWLRYNVNIFVGNLGVFYPCASIHSHLIVDWSCKRFLFSKFRFITYNLTNRHLFLWNNCLLTIQQIIVMEDLNAAVFWILTWFWGTISKTETYHKCCFNLLFIQN